MIILNFTGKTKVTFPEFLDLIGKVMEKSKNPEKEIHEGFRLYDQRKSGSISMKELRHVLMRNGEKLSQSECKFLLKNEIQKLRVILCHFSIQFLYFSPRVWGWQHQAVFHYLLQFYMF